MSFINEYDEIIKSAFSVLNYSLSSIDLRILSQFEFAISNLIIENLKSNNIALSRLTDSFETKRVRFHYLIECLIVKMFEVNQKKKSIFYAISKSLSFTNYRLKKQYDSAEKRVNDLIYEVILEYKKCILRIIQRLESIETRKVVKRIKSVQKLRWERFLRRLIYDISLHNNCSLTSRIIDDCSELKEEFSRLLEKSSRENFSFTAITELKLNISSKNLDKNDFESMVSISPIVSSIHAFKHILLSLNEEITKLNIQADASSKSPSKSNQIESMSQLLSLKSSNWIHTTSFDPNSFNLTEDSNSNDNMFRFLQKFYFQHMSQLQSDLVYFCLEERYFALQERMSNSEGCQNYDDIQDRFPEYKLLLNMLTSIQVCLIVKC